ncbi:DUF1542 domain-containing protein [Fructobacillus americanaquae]|uniref:DUF1542 domain-containing protein n=2 Tax=Fructobacillus americanaquae TaxID=2940302 RepID=A0ABY5C287_9LACO|nr:DUF1542 domain-containing protein [Fructobacillus americanaquae]
MYKAGKQWLVAGLATFALIGTAQIVSNNTVLDFGQSITAHAADTSSNYWFGQNTEYYKRYAETPNQSSVPKSSQMTWGYASTEIPRLANESNFQFSGLSYDQSTGKYTLTATLNVPLLTTGGSGRTSYFDMGFSNSLAAKTGNPNLLAANGSNTTLIAQNGVYSNQFSAGGNVGGTSTLTVQIDPVKVEPDDQITAMFSSDTGTTGYHAIFSVVRTLGYADFGEKFNNTLITQMKQNSTNAVNQSALSDKQKKAEQSAIDNVTVNDDFVNKLQTIDKDVAAKNKANSVSIDKQRATALQQYKDAHNVGQILNDIANDPTLTQSQKDAQSKQVNDAVDTISNNLNNAMDSDDVASVIADTSQDNAIATAYQPGTTLATQIKNAQDAIDTQLAKSQAAVDANSALSDAQKAAQKAALQKVANNAKNNIGTKTSADDINTAQTSGIKSLTDLDTAKPSAYSTLTNKANSAVATINGNQNLTDADKATRIAQVNDALKKVTDQIDQAIDAATVNSLAGSTDIDTAISQATSDNGVTPIDTQRKNANAAIDQTAADTKGKIASDANLSKTEKATQSANVDKAVEDAKNAIASGSAQVIADTVSKAQGIIAGSYVAGKPLPDRQKDAENALMNAASQAKTNLDAQVNHANNDINNNYLTDAQKAAQKQAIQDAADAAIKKINSATDADAVNQALSDGQNIVNNLNAEKLGAYIAVNTAVQNAETKINNNNDLTADQKKDRIAQIEAAKTTAENTIDSATDASVISGVPASGSGFDNAIKAATNFSGITSLTDQQATAAKAIDDANMAAKAKVDADKNLSDADKTAQKAALDTVAGQAKDAIAKTNTADGINQAQNAGETALMNLDKTADDASAAQKATDAHTAIDNNSALTQAQKDAFNQQIDQAKNAAQDAINQATDPTTAAQAVANGSDYVNKLADIAKQAGQVPSVADQQATAAKAIDDANMAAKAKVDADKNLSDADKTAQKAALDTVAGQAKDAIAKANTADGINQAQNAGETALMNLDKTADDASAAQKATDAHTAIDNNSALTQAQKDAFNQQIDQAKNAAQDAINQATDPTTAAQAVANGSDYVNKLADIAKQAGQVPSVADQQATAAKAIDDANMAAKAKVDADKNLSDADKTAQKAALDTVAGQAKDAIAKANTADGINQAQNAGETALMNLDKTADDASAAQKATDAHTAIDNNSALTQAQKDAFNQQIDQAKNAAQDAINQATDPTTAAQAVANGSDYVNKLADIAKQAGQVPSVADQQATAAKAIDDANMAAKAKVDADKNLSDADKTAQKAALDTVAGQAKDAIAKANTADGINQAQNAGETALMNLDKTADDASAAQKATDAHTAIDNNSALTQAQKDAFNQQIDQAKNAAQDAINQATDPTTAAQAVANGSDYVNKLADIAKQAGQVPSVADQQATAAKAIDDANMAAKAKVDADKNLSDADKTAQKAALDTVAGQAKDAIAKTNTADGINQAQNAGETALMNLDKTADDASAVQKATDAHTAIDNNSALTQAQKDAFNQQIDQAKNAAQDAINQATDPTTAAQAVANGSDYVNKLADIAKQAGQVPSLADQTKAAIEKLTEAVNQAKGALTGPDEDAQKQALDKALSDGTANLNAQTSADDLNKMLSNAVNNVENLNKNKTDALADLDAQAQKAIETINSNSAFTDDEKAARVAAVNKALQDVHDGVNTATDLSGVDAAHNSSTFPEALNNAISDAGVQTLADRKSDAQKALQDEADRAKDTVDSNQALSDAQKKAQKQAIDQALNTAQEQIAAATKATDVDVAKAANLPVFNSLNNAKTDAHHVEDKAYNDAKATIQNNSDLTDSEKQNRINDLVKAHQAASDAIDQAVTPDEIKGASETAAFNNAVKTATDFSGVTPLTERKQAGIATINAAEQKAIDEVNANTKLDADAKDRQIAVLKQQAQDAIAKLNSQTNAQGVVDFVPTVAIAFENLNQSKVNARAKLQENASATKSAIDDDDNLSNAEKQAQKDAVDVALQQAVTDVDNGQDVSTVNEIPIGSTVVKAINQGHVSSTKTPAQQENDLNVQIDDQAAKIKAEIDADVTLKAADKALQQQAVDNFVAETKAKIAGLTKYQDRLDVANQTLDNLKNLHQLGKPLVEQKAEALSAIDQKADQIRAQIANDSRLTQTQKDLDYQLVADAVAKAKAQVNGALNADDIMVGQYYGTAQLEAAYQRKVQEQYAEKQVTTSVLPQTSETDENRDGALITSALLASITGFFLGQANKRRKEDK